MPYGSGGNENCNTNINWSPSFPTASIFTAINNSSVAQTVGASLSVTYPDGSSGGMTGSFVIQPTQTSQPPTISAAAFPTQLTVGQTGTWAVNASDPQNGTLSYSVNWGDSGPIPVSQKSVSQNVVQSTTFTHSYSAAGNYIVTFTVTDSAGLSAKTSGTVQVNNPVPAYTPVPTPTPSPTVSTPPITPVAHISSNGSNLNLTWTDSDQDVYNFVIMQSSPQAFVASIGGTQGSYAISNVDMTVSHCYTVQAVGARGTVTSAPVCSTPIAPATSPSPSVSPAPSPSSTPSPSPSPSSSSQAMQYNVSSQPAAASASTWQWFLHLLGF